MLDPQEILSGARGRALCYSENEMVAAFAWRVLKNASNHLAGHPVPDRIPQTVYLGLSGWSESEAFLKAARARHSRKPDIQNDGVV